MKHLLIFSAIIMLAFKMQASTSLVLIPVDNLNQTQQHFRNPSLSIHFYNDNFLIATCKNCNVNNSIVLDKTPWEQGVSYYIIYTDSSIDKADYLEKIKHSSNILFDGGHFLIASTNEQVHGQIPPAKNDGMVRIFNIEARLPSRSFPKIPSIVEVTPSINQLIEEVSASNITATVQYLQDYGTRDAYSTQSVEAQIWIANYFTSLGLEVEVMDFTMPGGPASDNVIAKLMGKTMPNEYVAVGAHYDSRSWSGDAPGADDNASGTAGVMEIARILSEHEFDRTIVFCAFSGEEYGLYGSKAFANRCAQESKDIIGYINMDMIGYLKPGNTMLTSLIYPQTATELAQYYTAVCAAYLPLFVVQPATLIGGDSDHTSFNINGYMGIFPFENVNAYSPYIHTINDLIGPSYNNENQAAVFTKAAMATIASLATDDASNVSAISNRLNVYPNPAKDYFTVSLDTNSNVWLEVSNSLGQVIHVDSFFGTKRISTSSWQRGIYYIKVKTNSSTVSHRIVLQ